MPVATYLNEVELSSIECWPLDVDKWLSSPTREFPTVPIPGRNGVVLAGDPVVGARRLTLTVQVQPAARTATARVAAEGKLKAVATRGLVKIGVSDGMTASRVIDGVLTACDITPVGHPIAAASSRAVLTFLCPDPTWSDAAGQLIGFSATPSAIPQGTASSGGIIRIAAPGADVVNPTLWYLNAAGVTIATLGFAGTLSGTNNATSDYLEVDLDRARLTEYVGGVASNVPAWLTSGDFSDFQIDPTDADPIMGSYAQLKVTATSGAPSAIWYGARRWW